MDVDSNSTQRSSYARSNLPISSECRLLAPSDQDESSRSEKTGSKSLDIPTIPCPTNGLSTLSRRLHSGKRLAGPDDDVTDPSAIRLLQGHKTEVSNLITFMMNMTHMLHRFSFVGGIL